MKCLNLYHNGFYDFATNDMKCILFSVISSNPSIDDGEKIIYHNADVFLSCSCDIFAYVLHLRFGYDIYYVINESGSIFHCCCILDYDSCRFYIDVRGITNNFDEFLSYYNIDFSSSIEIQKVDDLSIILDDLDDGLVKFANELIDKYYNYYSFVVK